MSTQVAVLRAPQPRSEPPGEYLRGRNATSCVVILADLDGTVNYVSPAWTEFTGFRPEELPTRLSLELVHPKDRYRIAKTLRQLPSCECCRIDYRLLREDGDYVWIETHVDVIYRPGTTKQRQIVAVSHYLCDQGSPSADMNEERRIEHERLQLFEAFGEGARDYAILMLDPAGHVLSWNEGAARLKGYPESEIIGRHFSRFYTAEDVQAGHPERALLIAKAQGHFEQEGFRIRRDGSRFWANVLITALFDKDGNLRGFTKLTRDVSERKRAEERLKEAERNLRRLADAMPQIVWTTGADTNEEYHNQQFYAFTGFQEGGNETWESLVHPDELEACRVAKEQGVELGTAYEIQCRFWDRRTADYRWHLTRGLPLLDENGQIEQWVVTSTDIDDHMRLSLQLEQRVEERTTELRQSLLEKTTLLKEVHHRVKNNLQVICSLLSMQIACSDNQSSSQPLQEAHRRVLAMSLIHEQLYQSETLADLDFGEYMRLLSSRLFAAYCIDSARIRLRQDMNSIHLNVDQAIPCGLILNELLSNSLKHAFPDGRKGTIRITLREVDSGYIEMVLADDGVGLPDGFVWEESRSLGLQVVRTLVIQLRADLSISSDGGTIARFRWRRPAAENQPHQTLIS